ncbi:MAG: metal ABC transporter substrate-binding protein [Eubacteriales bacterium]
MKKIISLVLALFLICGAAICTASCSGDGFGDSDKISVVTTIFPAYDWTREILGDNADNVSLTMLLDNSVDLHSYQPTADDMAKIAGCDMFIYVGGESDEWVEDALSAVGNKKMITVNMLDVLGDAVLEEEILDGMEHEYEDEEHEHEDDEHVWLSLKNAEKICTYIAKKLSALDPDNASVYTDNVEKYKANLSALDAKYQDAVDSAAYDTLIFADRFPFRYLTEDYGLSYYAAFSGCSAESEASVETIAFLAGKLSELGLPAVMIIDGSDGSIASTVIKTAGGNQDILTLNSLQSVTSADVKNGTSYLSVMESNLEVLKKALN